MLRVGVEAAFGSPGKPIPACARAAPGERGGFPGEGGRGRAAERRDWPERAKARGRGAAWPRLGLPAGRSGSVPASGGRPRGVCRGRGGLRGLGRRLRRTRLWWPSAFGGVRREPAGGGRGARGRRSRRRCRDTRPARGRARGAGCHGEPRSPCTCAWAWRDVASPPPPPATSLTESLSLLPSPPTSPAPPFVCAGTDRHELTSWKSFPSIFKFFTEASEAKSSSLKPALTRRSYRIKHEEL